MNNTSGFLSSLSNLLSQGGVSLFEWGLEEKDRMSISIGILFWITFVATSILLLIGYCWGVYSVFGQISAGEIPTTPYFSFAVTFLAFCVAVLSHNYVSIRHPFPMAIIAVGVDGGDDFVKEYYKNVYAGTFIWILVVFNYFYLGMYLAPGTFFGYPFYVMITALGASVVGLGIPTWGGIGDGTICEDIQSLAKWEFLIGTLLIFLYPHLVFYLSGISVFFEACRDLVIHQSFAAFFDRKWMPFFISLLFGTAMYMALRGFRRMFLGRKDRGSAATAEVVENEVVETAKKTGNFFARFLKVIFSFVVFVVGIYIVIFVFLFIFDPKSITPAERERHIEIGVNAIEEVGKGFKKRLGTVFPDSGSKKPSSKPSIFSSKPAPAAFTPVFVDHSTTSSVSLRYWSGGHYPYVRTGKRVKKGQKILFDVGRGVTSVGIFDDMKVVSSAELKAGESFSPKHSGELVVYSPDDLALEEAFRIQ